MKILAIILSAGVVAGLAVYALLSWWRRLGLLGDQVVMQIDTFVMTLAGVGFGSAGLALLFRTAFVRADRTAVQKLEERIARLEAGGAP